MIPPLLTEAIVEWSFPTRIRFGPRAVEDLPEELAAAGVRRPLIVTDRGLVDTPAFARVREVLADLEAPVYSGVEPNPLAEQADAGAAAYREGGCDGVIGVGGGSALDVAKIVRVLAGQGGKALDYEFFHGPRGRAITAEQPFLVAIPTTAGTGSEVGRSSVVTDPASRRKVSVFSRHMLPPLVLCDPELTLSLPKSVTAHTGMDALTHSTEAYLTPGFHPLADGVALEAIGLIGGALRRAVADGSDLAARCSMMAAALMGAVAFQKGLGATHALAHPLSTLAGLPHGLANALLLPHMLRFNHQTVPQRVAAIGRALAGDEDAAAAVEALAKDVGLPTTLAAAGVDRALLDDLVAQASQEHLLGENPRPVNEADIRVLYLQAFGDA